MPVTLKVIAKKADVTPMVVSAVVRDDFSRIRVSDEKKKKIKKLVEKLRYVPNPTAQSLVRRETRVINAYIPSMRFFERPLQHNLVTGLQRYLNQQGYRLSFTSLRMDGKAVDIPENVPADASLFFFYGKANLPYIEAIRKFPVPLLVFGHCPVPGVTCIYQDNKKAMYELTCSLIKKGHTRIAHVSTFIGDVYHNDGVEGLTRAIKEHGIESYQQIPVPSDTEQEDRVARLIPAGKLAVDELLKLDPQPTAVIFNVDTQALGAIQELHRRGIKIPETYSIAANGCDSYTSMLQPSLTKVTVDSLGVGARCAKTLLDLILKKKVAETQKIPMQIYEGDSVRPHSA